MKYWLVALFFTPDGKYIDKMETLFETYGACTIAAGKLTMDFINTGTKVQTWCVSDDHKTGVKPDEGIPYDDGDLENG